MGDLSSGITVLEQLTSDERQLLSSLSSSLLKALPCDEPCHVMIKGYGVNTYQRSKFIAPEIQVAVEDLASKLTSQIENGPTTLLSLRILIAPPGCSAQEWHLDYRASGVEENHTVFVAMSPTSEDNCTELMRFRCPIQAAAFEQQVSPLSFLPNPQSDRRRTHERYSPQRQVSIEPLLMDCYEAVRVETWRLIHRRGQNKSNFPRVTLNVDYTRSSPQEVDKVGFVDDDSQAGIESGGVVGLRHIDDLHSEVRVKVSSLAEAGHGL